MPPSKTKFITIYSNTAESKINFKNDISSKRIYDKLDKNLHADPNINYNILEKKIINSIETHMQKKTVKFNRRKHKRDPWITFGILRSVNKKNQLYRTLKQTKMNLEIYEIRKQRFNQYKNTLRKTIKPKRSIFQTSLADLKVMAKKHGKQLIMHFIGNHVKQYLMQYLLIQIEYK